VVASADAQSGVDPLLPELPPSLPLDPLLAPELPELLLDVPLLPLLLLPEPPLDAPLLPLPPLDVPLLPLLPFPLLLFPLLPPPFEELEHPAPETAAATRNVTSEARRGRKIGDGRILGASRGRDDGRGARNARLSHGGNPRRVMKETRGYCTYPQMAVTSVKMGGGTHCLLYVAVQPLPETSGPETLKLS